MPLQLRRFAFFAPLLFVVAFAVRADAFSCQSPITSPCHENITFDAYRIVRNTNPAAKALPLSDDDRPVFEDLPFDVPDDLEDLATMSLVVGVRDNDLKGLASTSLDELADITSRDELQREHCLRSNEETEPGGTKPAVDDCRAYILSMLTSALEGLDANGLPDPSIRQSIQVALAVRGQLYIPFQTFYLRMGMAMHAIEDSFAHTWRSQSDPHKITVTLNWIAYAESRIDEPVTGPAHETEMDRCDDPDDLRAERRKLAIEAAAMALTIGLDTTQTRDQKIASFQNLLDTYVVYDDGSNCTKDNAWCNAPEAEYANPSCRCDLPGRSSTSPNGVVVALGAVGLLIVARRSNRRRFRLAAPALALVGVLFGSSVARADEDAPLPTTSSDYRAGSFFGDVALGGSYGRSALVGRLGGRYGLSKMFMVGLDAEWNPYLAFGETGFRKGSFNAYASLLGRFQLAYAPVSLRSSVSAGTSVLLFDLAGAKAGSVGPYFGISPLALDVKLRPHLYLTIDPTSIAIPVPHLTGIPFVYYQYRFVIGLEFGG